MFCVTIEQGESPRHLPDRPCRNEKKARGRDLSNSSSGWQLGIVEGEAGVAAQRRSWAQFRMLRLGERAVRASTAISDTGF